MVFVGLPSFLPPALREDSAACSFRDEPPLLLGECCVEVEHEWVGIGPEFSNDERHALNDQSGNEGNVSGKAIKLGNQDWAFCNLGRGERSSKLRSPVECVGALAGPTSVNPLTIEMPSASANREICCPLRFEAASCDEGLGSVHRWTLVMELPPARN